MHESIYKKQIKELKTQLAMAELHIEFVEYELQELKKQFEDYKNFAFGKACDSIIDAEDVYDS